MLTFGAGGQFQDGVAAGIVGQHDRHAAGTEVQHDEEPLVELAFEAEDVWRRADQALRTGLQRGFARAQVDQPADERERRPGIVLLRFHAEESGVGDDRQPGLRGGEAEVARVGSELPNRPASETAAKIAPPLLLAETWDGSADLAGWWMGEKLEGVRAYWTGKAFLSRLGEVVLPGPGTVLQEGDVLHMIALEQDLERISAALSSRAPGGKASKGGR